MNPSNETTEPTPDEARAALDSVERISASGIKHGVYPRWFAVAMSIWAGSLAATAGMPVWPLIFAGGLIAHHYWRQRRTVAWVNETGSQRDLWIVIGLGLFFGSLFVAAFVAKYQCDLTWLPVVAGVLVALGLFLVTEITYGKTRTRIASEETR